MKIVNGSRIINYSAKSLVQFTTINVVNLPNLENLMATSMQHTAPTYVVSNIAWGGCHNLSGIPVVVDIV